jgi:hypothetical protein
MSETTATPIPDQIRLVRQEHDDACAIACMAMIVSISYREAWGRLAPPPAKAEFATAYLDREIALLNEKGWWPSAQLLLKTVISPEDLDSIIDGDDKFRKAVENSQRVLLVLAFSDGAKPDHSVVWDRDCKDVVFDPSRGEVSIAKLFNDVGLQAYSGIVGLTAFCYQPGQPVQTLIKTEEGFVPTIVSKANG